MSKLIEKTIKGWMAAPLLSAMGLAALLTGPAFAAEASVEASATSPLIQVEDARFRAMVARDVAGLDKMIAADAIYIHANGIVQSKGEYLKDVAEGRSRYRAIEAAERSISLSGKQAITHALVRLHVGTDRIIVARTTGLYRQVGGKWQVIVWQSTPVTAVAPVAAPPAPAK